MSFYYIVSKKNFFCICMYTLLSNNKYLKILLTFINTKLYIFNFVKCKKNLVKKKITKT